MDTYIKNFLDFYQKAEKLKTTMRQSHLSDPTRQESTAEHTWMMSLLAVLLSDKLDPNMDTLRVLKMVIIHDLAEAITGDIPSFEISKRKEDKYMNEQKSLVGLLSHLPKELADELLEIWEEFEAKQTLEAQFVQSLDKIEATMQHNLSDLSRWGEGEFRVHPYYRDEYFNFNPTMRAIKDKVDIQSMEKIISAGMQDKIDPKHLDRFNTQDI